MTLQEIKDKVSILYTNRQLQASSVQFFRSCISQGLIPLGIRVHFNLAMDVNTEDFVQQIKRSCDKSASRKLDLIYAQAQKKLEKLEAEYEAAEIDLANSLTESVLRRFIVSMKREASFDIERKIVALKRKLLFLRREKEERDPSRLFIRSDG